jgi:uncharacterized membrane protein YccC
MRKPFWRVHPARFIACKSSSAATECGLSGATVVAALLLGSIISTWLFINEREALRSAETANAKEMQLRREAELRETVKEIGLLMAQNHYDQADQLLSRVPVEKPSPETEGPVAHNG